MRQPAIRDVTDVIDHCGIITCGLKDGRIVPARTMGFHSVFNRLKATYLVFTGKADAVTWPGQ